MYTFMVVGDKLYRVNTTSGETWKENYGQWDRVKEK